MKAKPTVLHNHLTIYRSTVSDLLSVSALPMPPQARSVALVHDAPKTGPQEAMLLISSSPVIPLPLLIPSRRDVENTGCVSQAQGLKPIWQFLNSSLQISCCQTRNHRCPCLVRTVLNLSCMLDICVLPASQNAVRPHRCRSARKRPRLAKI